MSFARGIGFRGEEARRHRIDGDAVAAELGGEGARQRREATFGCRVDGIPVIGEIACNRGDVDDAPALRFGNHEPRGMARELEGGDEIGLQQRPHIGKVEFEEAPPVTPSDIVDQDIETARLRRDLGEGLGHGLRVSDVEGEGFRREAGSADRRNLARQRRFRTAIEEHMRARFGERLGDGEAEPAARAGDERRLAGEIKGMLHRQS
jgi:hypothetical protein